MSYYKKNIKIINKIFDFWGENDFIEIGKEIPDQVFASLIFIAHTRDIPMERLGKMLQESKIKGDDIMPTLAQRLEKKAKKEGKLEGIEIGRQEGRQEGKQEGKRDEKIETAKKMFKLNYTIKNIAAVTDLSIDELKKIQKDLE